MLPSLEFSDSNQFSVNILDNFVRYDHSLFRTLLCGRFDTGHLRRLVLVDNWIHRFMELHILGSIWRCASSSLDYSCTRGGGVVEVDRKNLVGNSSVNVRTNAVAVRRKQRLKNGKRDMNESIELVSSVRDSVLSDVHCPSQAALVQLNRTTGRLKKPKHSQSSFFVVRRPSSI